MRSGVASWHPRRLFAGGVPGALYLPRPGTCRVLSDGSGSPAVVGDPIGWLQDESGNGNHATQVTTASKPILRQDSGGRWYLEFDSSDDSLDSNLPAGGFTARTDGWVLDTTAYITGGHFTGRSPTIGTGVWRISRVSDGTNFRLFNAGGSVWQTLGNPRPTSVMLIRLTPSTLIGRRNGVETVNTAHGEVFNGSATTILNAAASSSGFGGMNFYGRATLDTAVMDADMARLERYLARLGGVDAMTAYVHRLIVVVPADWLPRAQRVAQCVDPDIGGDLSFSIRLSATGQEPPTHYATASPATVETAQIAVAPPDQATTWLNHVQAERFPERELFTAAELADFLGAATIRVDQPLGDVLAELDLQRIEAPADA